MEKLNNEPVLYPNEEVEMIRLLENFRAALQGGNTNQIIKAAFYLNDYDSRYPFSIAIYPRKYHTLLRWARRIVFHGID